MASVLISSVNFNGQIGNITFYPEIGGTVNIGLQTIPYIYTANDIYGTYDIYFSEYPITCSVTILNPYIPLDCDLVIDSSTPSPTSTPSSTNTPTPTSTLVPPTPTGTSVPPTSTPTPTSTLVPPTSTPTPTSTLVPPTPTSTSVPPTPTATDVSSCMLFTGCANTTFSCGCETQVNVYWKDNVFYKTLSNCENSTNDWNSFHTYYYYNGMKYEIGSNGTVITEEGCS
jgi:hypothetical protein